jgi:hypothetical protein
MLILCYYISINNSVNNSELVAVNNDVSKSDILYTPKTVAYMLKFAYETANFKRQFWYLYLVS